MRWGEIPVLEFYGIKHTDCPEIISSERATEVPDHGPLVGFFAICANGQVERDKSKTGLAICGIFEAEDVLMTF